MDDVIKGKKLKHFPKSKSSKSPFTVRERFEIVKKWKLDGDDPREFMKPYFEKYGRPLPAIPEQAISFFPSQVEQLVLSGNAEAIRLAEELEMFEE